MKLLIVAACGKAEVAALRQQFLAGSLIPYAAIAVREDSAIATAQYISNVKEVEIINHQHNPAVTADEVDSLLSMPYEGQNQSNHTAVIVVAKPEDVRSVAYYWVLQFDSKQRKTVSVADVRPGNGLLLDLEQKRVKIFDPNPAQPDLLQMYTLP